MKVPKIPTGLSVWLRARVNPARFLHVQGVAVTVEKLAKRWGLSVEKAKWAAWLHDSAKELSRGEMKALVRGTPFQWDRMEEQTPALWHPHAGAALARKKWGIQDREVLEAIRCHTLGKPGMGLLAQAVFVADFIEPGRDFPGVARARDAARKSLGEGVLAKTSMTLEFLLERSLKIHPRLLETWNYFLKAARL